MKKHLINLLLFPALLTLPCCRQTPVYRNSDAPIDKRVEDLLGRMTLREKVLQMSQYHFGGNDNTNNIPERYGEDPREAGSVILGTADKDKAEDLQKKAVNETRLGIPILFGYDVIHGYRTLFPIPLAQAASFEPALATKAAEMAAREATAAGVRWTFSPMVDIARDPRWGRIAEGYGEDPYLASRFSKAVVRGYQGERLSSPTSMAACLKHYVGYGASEAGRDYVYTEISRQTLWDTYLPPFKAGVDAGCHTVMSAFNDISGVPATANPYTLTEILRNRWGFDGFVVSDWRGVKQLLNQGFAHDEKEAASLAFGAGLDMDMIDNVYLENLEPLVREGAVKEREIDDAVRRILKLKFSLGLFEHPYPSGTGFDREEALELSREMARRSFVLLKNEGVLPLSKDGVMLTGPLAEDRHEVLGSWRAHAMDAETVSVREAFEKEGILLSPSASVAVVCLGEIASWSGENASRSDISLPEEQVRLLRSVKQAGKKTVTVISAGRPVDLREIEPLSDAILYIWQPGTMAGYAVADVLTGRVNPSGKLPVSFPRSVGQIPIHYNRRAPARTGTMGRYQDIPSSPLYPFGYGLSYSRFEYSPVSLEGLKATVTVTNASAVDGEETVLWYITDVAASVTRPALELKYFEKKLIPAGESRVFSFDIVPERDLSFPDHDGKTRLERGAFLLKASYSDPVSLIY